MISIFRFFWGGYLFTFCCSESIEIIWACGKNERVSYGQKGVDGGSKWRTGTRETEVKLDGWCVGGLGQQRNLGGGCATMRERSETVKSPGAYIFFKGEFY